MRRLPRRRIALLLALAVNGVLATPALGVPYGVISSKGPLTSIALGIDLTCQVAHISDDQLELYPPSQKPGDCGTFVALGGTLLAPTFTDHPQSGTSFGLATPWDFVSQTPMTGAGTVESPYRIVTTVDGAGGSGLRLVQADSYIQGQESYRTDVTLQNRTGGPLTGVLYRAGDCHMHGTGTFDRGFGFVDVPRGAVGCSANPRNVPRGRIEQWLPITPGSTFMEARASQIWTHIATRTPFPSTARSTESHDNAAGLSWSFTLAAGGEATYSHHTTFSPRGVAGPPAFVVPRAAFGRDGIIEAPSTGRCLSRRSLRIGLQRLYWPTIASVRIRVGGVTRTLRRSPWRTTIDLGTLSRPRFAVRITAVTRTGRTIRGVRRYRTCAVGTG